MYIYDICYASCCLQGNKTGKEYDTFTTFNVALALVTSSIKRLEEGVSEH